MKISCNLFGGGLSPSLIVGLTFWGLACAPAAPKEPQNGSQAKPSAAKSGNLVPLVLDLPAAAFEVTRKDLLASPNGEPRHQWQAFDGHGPAKVLLVGPNLEPVSDKPRPPMMVPPGLKNVALGAKVSCSDKGPWIASADTLAKVVDGDKGASDDSVIFLPKGTQWVQLDLGSVYETFAIVIWHAHNFAKIYHNVIVQTADDPNFIQNVHTLFNNDLENTSGLGVGTDREYYETNEGKLIDAKGAKARYFRFYSKGSTESALNEYTEIEIYGRAPAVAAASRAE